MAQRVITDDDVHAYGKATGGSPEDARYILVRMKPRLRERVLRAARSKPHRGGLLRDPVEVDPSTRKLVRHAAAKANRAVPFTGLGTCHSIWEEQARILWKEHKIRWYSPAEMNPGVEFD